MDPISAPLYFFWFVLSMAAHSVANPAMHENFEPVEIVRSTMNADTSVGPPMTLEQCSAMADSIRFGLDVEGSEGVTYAVTGVSVCVPVASPSP